MFMPAHSAGAVRVVRAQLALLPVCALLAGIFAGFDAALAAAYGVSIALASAALLAWRERQAGQHPEWDQHRLMKVFIRVSLERLALLAGLLGLGFAVLDLLPLWLLLGLVGGQLGWIAAAGRQRKQ